MSEGKEDHGLRMAKSPKEEREAMWAFFQRLEEMVIDPDTDLYEIGEYVADEIEEGLVGSGWRRLVWGFETLLENVCDPDKNYLDWKPEYKVLSVSGGARAIAEERQRQIDEEGYTAEHDDQWKSGELVRAAISYALLPEWWYFNPHSWFPFDSIYMKKRKHHRIKQLAIAGAWIAAEIDRLNRIDTRWVDEE